jgi:hypothetical protein
MMFDAMLIVAVVANLELLRKAAVQDFKHPTLIVVFRELWRAFPCL